MKKFFLLALGSVFVAMLTFAQTSTALFENESVGSTSFTDNGVVFNITSSVSTFDVFALNGGGWTGSGTDNRFIDNTGTATSAFANAALTIRTTSNLFKVNRFWVYLADRLVNQNSTGTLTVTGRRGNIDRFTETKTTGFATGPGSTNGFTLIDLTNLNGQNYSDMLLDEITLTLGGNYRYLALDAFTWVKDSQVLPVTFGSVKAFYKNNQLTVSWTTEKETANHHFEIETSTDGQQFTKIATIGSKATHGNSDVTLTYEWTSDAVLPLTAFSLVALALIPVSGIRRKKNWLAGLAAACMATMFVGGCSKSGDAIGNNESYFIRLAQVDQDGTTSHSKVVRVQQAR